MARITEEKFHEVFVELRKHDIDKDSMFGVFLMAQTDENLDIIMDYLLKHPEADQTEIMQFAVTLYDGDNE